MLNCNKHIARILIAALFLTGLFSYTGTAYGATTYTTYETTTCYRLDTGVSFLWKNSAGTWQKGWEPGYRVTYPTDITIPKNAENVTAKAYQQDAEYGEVGYFPFESENGIAGDCIIWNTTDVADNKDDYDTYYNAFAAYPLFASGDYTSSTGKLEINYNATFSAYGGEVYDVKTKLAKGESGKQEIIALLGSPSAEITKAMDLMNPESENYNANVEGYLYFLPVVIKYDILEAVQHTINGFEPGLDIPTSAKAGEEYTVTDTTEFEDDPDFACSFLYYSVDGGAKQEVEGWNGTTLGESIKQTFDDVCTVTYTLTVWNKWNTDKSVSKTINITDDREITVNADLELPLFTYEGHTEIAKDVSTFDVDGVAYSATRAYAEGIATNSFKCSSSYVHINRLTDTKAECTFEKTGTYSVNLKIKTITGGTAADTESIEVRKTPYILDNLSGFQKQNRKQVLTATVATYPGKPITDYSITLKDKVTGNSVTLTPDNLQENNTTIKTRAVTMTQDLEKGFAYITVEFLTKTPAYTAADPDYTQQFYYQINVTDSKGDEDSASRYFDVKPDRPPVAAISLDTAFLRNEGTNVASIKAEDATVAVDGDDVARIWHYGATTSPAVFTNVSTMDGYAKLSFGTDKIVGFNRTGVGRFTTKLFVKEVWTEPTLEEYVNDADHLTGTAIAYSEVQNVAPIVSLELLNSTEQEVLLLANNDAEYQTLLNGKTALQQALLANCIDGQIIIKKLLGSTPSTVAGVTKQLEYTYPTNIGMGLGDDAMFLLSTDSERAYYLTWNWANGQSTDPTVPKTIHACSPYAGEVWSYTTNRDESFTFGKDDTDKYLYLVYADSDQTVLLDKRTGAVAGTINAALSDNVWLSDNLAFFVKDNCLYALNMSSLAKNVVAENISAVSRVNGNLEFITSSSDAMVRCTVDMETLDLSKERLASLGEGVASSDCYQPICIDSTGKAILWKNAGYGSDSFNGIRVYSVENKLIKEIPAGNTNVDYTLNPYFSLDENGACNHVLIWSYSRSGGKHYLTGADLNTGATSIYSKTNSSLNLTAENFGGAFELNGISYFMFPGWFINQSSGYYGSAFCFKFTGSSCTISAAAPGAIGNYDEGIRSSDRIIASMFGDNSSGTLQLKISAFPKTLVQETKEVIARFTGKLTFLGGVNTTAGEIKAAAESPRPAIKVTAAQNGCLLLSNTQLVQNKKYYYEYDIKSLTSGTKDKLTGISVTHDTASTSQPTLDSTYYVENTYKEDFNDSTIDRFFTVDDPGTSYAGRYGASYNNPADTYSKMIFTVPAGKQAILSFDYLQNFAPICYKCSVYVDGIKMYEPYPAAVSTEQTGHCVFQNILSEGAHTIECSLVGNSSSVYAMVMDNLKVEIISAAPHTLSASFNTEERDVKGWLTAYGSFETPNSVISYGSQASSFYSGGLGGTITDSYRPAKYGTAYPFTVEYPFTVPAGYYVRGLAYPQLVNSDGHQVNLNIGKYTYTMVTTAYRNVESGEAVMTGLLTEGPYTFIINGSYMYNYPSIPKFDFVYYPINDITSSGDIAFDSTNTKYYFPKQTYNGTSSLSIPIPKGEYLIKNLKLYYIENGQKIYIENGDLEELSDLSSWTLSAGLAASVITEQEEKADDEYVKIYKKGEKVLYNIFYTDYEKDASKAGYWVYTHINWPPDTVHPDVGKILTAPIDCFYLSGKYTVTHWETDNTQRTGTVGDATPYNKESNKVTMTFYVDGEGKAPWVTYIRTEPAAVKENNSYAIQVGVDDTEKDTLALETEVYLNGKSILTDYKTGIKADSNGDYPVQTISGLPAAKAGVYQVVCTVSDYSGTGIKSYKFMVVSEGKITGSVNHTDQWEVNRKTYNLKRFSEEINRTMQLNDYIAMAAPRKRGTNVFWSGEKFMLRSETEGGPSKVTVQILSKDAQGNEISTGYSKELTNTGRKTAAGAELWEGSLWDTDMINKWGMSLPEELSFRFTAYYDGGLTKVNTVMILMDSDRDYWQLHRLW